MSFDRSNTTLKDYPAISRTTALVWIEWASVGHSITVETHGTQSPEAAQSRAELEFCSRLLFHASGYFRPLDEQGDPLPREEHHKADAERIQAELRRAFQRHSVTVTV